MDSKNYFILFKRAFSNLFNWESYDSPGYFYLLLLIPFLIVWWFVKEKKDRVLMERPSVGFVSKLERNYSEYFSLVPRLLWVIAMFFLIVALARPQDSHSWEEEEAKGIDIVLAMDVSTSMLARDFKPNRVEASKNIAKEFITGRSNDRFGLVVFAGESFTQCPLTIDHDRLIQLFDGVGTGILEDGTAIGSGLATSIKRLKNSKAESKVVVLLTDGENNSGDIAPEVAAKLATRFGIRVYTIAVAKEGKVESPAQMDFQGNIIYDMIESKIDVKLLKEIAEQTGGRYFRATGNNHLRKIYDEIDELEKTELASLKFSSKTELYLPFALVSFLLIVVAKLIEVFVFKKLNVS